MKGTATMPKEKDSEYIAPDEALTIGCLMNIIRACDSKDRTKYLGEVIDTELKNAIIAVERYNKSAKLKINLVITPIENGKETTISADVNLTKPKGKPSAQPFFRDNKGNIYLDDPQTFTKGEVVQLDT
jgi:hypothetical protein